ncbi:MAG: hypothetical protein R6X31_08290 [Anaerolineae bacterium]
MGKDVAGGGVGDAAGSPSVGAAVGVVVASEREGVGDVNGGGAHAAALRMTVRTTSDLGSNL